MKNMSLLETIQSNVNVEALTRREFVGAFREVANALSAAYRINPQIYASGSERNSANAYLANLQYDQSLAEKLVGARAISRDLVQGIDARVKLSQVKLDPTRILDADLSRHVRGRSEVLSLFLGRAAKIHALAQGGEKGIPEAYSSAYLSAKYAEDILVTAAELAYDWNPAWGEVTDDAVLRRATKQVTGTDLDALVVPEKGVHQGAGLISKVGRTVVIGAVALAACAPMATQENPIVYDPTKVTTEEQVDSTAVAEPTYAVPGQSVEANFSKEIGYIEVMTDAEAEASKAINTINQIKSSLRPEDQAVIQVFNLRDKEGVRAGFVAITSDTIWYSFKDGSNPLSEVAPLGVYENYQPYAMVAKPNSEDGMTYLAALPTGFRSVFETDTNNVITVYYPLEGEQINIQDNSLGKVEAMPAVMPPELLQLFESSQGWTIKDGKVVDENGKVMWVVDEESGEYVIYKEELANFDKEIVVKVSQTYNDLRGVHGIKIDNVSFVADEKAWLRGLKGFPMSPDAVALFATRLAAENDYYHGSNPHNPLKDQMPDSYIQEYAQKWAEVRDGTRPLTDIVATTYAWLPNSGSEQVPMQLAFYCDQDIAPAGVTCINNINYEFYLDAAESTEKETVLKNMPRMDVVGEDGYNVAYEVEVDPATGTMTVKINVPSNFNTGGRPFGQMANYFAWAYEYVARNKGQDVTCPTGSDDWMLGHGFKTEIDIKN